MDLETIKSIINSDKDNLVKEAAIIKILSKDKNVIPFIMNILNEERYLKNNLISDMNQELSRAHIYLDGYDGQNKKKAGSFTREFVIDKISEFYIKYTGSITHCFNRFIN